MVRCSCMCPKVNDHLHLDQSSCFLKYDRTYMKEELRAFPEKQPAKYEVHRITFLRGFGQHKNNCCGAF